MDSIETRVERIFDEVLWGESVPVRKRTKLNSVKWDSLAHLNLIVTIEQEFGVQLAGDEVLEMASFDAVVGILSDKLAPSA